uniref:BLTX566 n=1 Tax=Nephila pilipes TaxID=299642 RepID=A0A076KZX1_NEPPI|nr:BLTX566 [Nephila pilipes]
MVHPSNLCNTRRWSIRRIGLAVQ